jgi:hypothetical protein
MACGARGISHGCAPPVDDFRYGLSKTLVKKKSVEFRI